MSWPVALEKWLDPSPWLPYVLTTPSIVIGLLLGALLLSLMGTQPWDAYREMARGAFGSVYSLSETLVKATPLLLAGLGVGSAFRCLHHSGLDHHQPMQGAAAPRHPGCLGGALHPGSMMAT